MKQVLIWLCSPFGIGVVLLVVAMVWKRQLWLQCSAFTWLVLWSLPIVSGSIGLWLEKPFPYVEPSTLPVCDVVVVLGGGMGLPNKLSTIPDLHGGADRDWHGARLWHTGRAKYVMPSGSCAKETACVFLKDLGVPDTAIIIEDKALTTVENGIFARKKIDEKKLSRKVLLVTSAWHMRRAMMIFRAVGLDPVPAAVDSEAGYDSGRDLRMSMFVPNAQGLVSAGIYVKEIQGLFADKIRVMRTMKKQGIGNPFVKGND